MTKNIMYEQVTEENCMIRNDNGVLVPNYDITIVDFDEGDILKGRVVKIDKDEVLVDVGFKSEGVIPINELSIRNSVKPDEVLSLEDEIEIMVLQKEDQEGRLILSKKRAEVEKSFDKIESIYQNDETVEGQVIEYVKGGLILDIGLRGFLPASLIDVKKTRDLSSYIGERYACKIIEVDRNRNNVVLSRKAIIEDERKEQRKEVLGNIEVGQVRTGAITSIADFGAFVDVDGIDGLIHISELSWNHVKHPSEVVKVGQEVNVEILDIDYEKQRLSLGLKQTQKDPWVEKIKTYKIGDIVQGKVTRIVKFGLFVQIQEDMEGLVHISELSVEPVKKPSDVAKIGDELIVKIIDIDFDKRRMAFSIKQVTNPETASEQSVKLDDVSEELSEEEEKIKDDKPEAADIKIEENTPEREREKAIKEILKEMKDEANL
jgi:small subunit ribosomal protein S1